MSRGDSFDRFQPPDRGRFGDNETSMTALERQRGRGPRVTGASDLCDLDLYLHNDNPSKKAIAVSLDPKTVFERWQWLPRSLIEYEATAPGQVRVTMPEKLALEKGLI